MNHLLTTTAISAIGSFSGNRIVRYASDTQPSLKKFNTHDFSAIVAGTVTPVILSTIKTSLRSVTGFHGVTGFVIAGSLTYLFNKKEKSDLDLKEVTELLDGFSQKVHKNIEEIFDIDNPKKDTIKKNFSNEWSLCKEKYKNKFLTKEKITEDINKISSNLEHLKTAHQAFNQYYDNTDFDNFDLTDQTIINVSDTFTKACDNFIESSEHSIFARSMCDTMKYILNTNTNKFAEIRKKIRASKEKYEMNKQLDVLINRFENLKDNLDNNHGRTKTSNR